MTEPKDSAKGTRGIDEGLGRSEVNSKQGMDYSVEIRVWYTSNQVAKPVSKQLSLYCSGNWSVRELYENVWFLGQENCRLQELTFLSAEIRAISIVREEDESSSSGSSS